MEWASFIEPSARNSERTIDEWPLENKKWDLPSIPKDSEGFVKSFSIEDEQSYLQFFNEFGFVVIKNIIPKSEVEDTIREIWNELEGKNNPNSRPLTTAEQLYIQGAQFEKAGNPMQAMEYYRKAFRLQPELENEDLAADLVANNRPKTVDRNDPRTWDSVNWPTAQAVGFVGSEPAYGPQAWKNRTNENVYKVFSTLMKYKELWVSVDRYGIMRPTKNVPLDKLPNCEIRTSVEISEEMKESVKLEDKPEWITIRKWTMEKDEGLPYVFEDFISDENGTRNEGLLKLQGIISLADASEQDGGFCLVPGFHKHLEEWAKLTVNTNYKKAQDGKFGLVSVPEDDSLHSYLAKIPVRSGDLIVWRSEMPHCNFPNSSNRFRINQYVKMFAAKEGAKGTVERRQQIRRKLPPSFVVSELGMKVLGLKNWSD